VATIHQRTEKKEEGGVIERVWENTSRDGRKRGQTILLAQKNSAKTSGGKLRRWGKKGSCGRDKVKESRRQSTKGKANWEP